MARSHIVVVKGEDGIPRKHALKTWLRRNPAFVPDGLDPDASTSHRLRAGLKKMGWRLEFAPNEVLIVQPDADRRTDYAEDLLEEADLADDVADAGAADDQVELKFGLERDLQDALRRDIKQLGPRLAIIDGGTEASTEAGRIDILCEDSDGTKVIVELKAGQADSRVVAQILAYMASIAERDQSAVRGIIVAGDFIDRVILAAKAVPNLELRRYTYKFQFESA